MSRIYGAHHMGTSCKTAYLGENRVAVRMIKKKNLHIDRKLFNEMRLMTTLKHANLAFFHGVCIDYPNLCILWEYCNKGSIEDVIRGFRTHESKLDIMLQLSMALDICTGLAYLHNSKVKVHGNLKSSNCLIDDRWTCKLSGFGQGNLLKEERCDVGVDGQQQYSALFWTAPEGVRLILEGERYLPNKQADMYSVAIILKQLLCQNQAYDEELNAKGMTPKEIAVKVSGRQGDTLFRPCMCQVTEEVGVVGVVGCLVHLVHACWQEEPSLRPQARQMVRHLRKLSPFSTNNIMDNMTQMMEIYSSRLEELVAHRTSQNEDETQRQTVCNLLPQKVAADWTRGYHVPAMAIKSVTIYFSNIVGFTQIASHSTPMEIVDFLDDLYALFDEIVQIYDVYKVETVADSYMAVSGTPVQNGRRHVTIMADMALEMLQAVFNFVIPHMPDTQLRVRIGLNTGPVVAGVIGNVLPRYCLFGDAVTLASTMESRGSPLRIHLSPYTYEALRDHTEYIVTERGEIDIKGKGKIRTYFLDGKDSQMKSHVQEDK